MTSGTSETPVQEVECSCSEKFFSPVFAGKPMATKCDNCVENDQRASQIAEDERKQQEMVDRVKRSIPPAYASLSFDTIESKANQSEAVEAAKNIEHFLFLYGETGTGKTMIAYCTARKWILEGHKVCVVKAIDMFNQIRSGFSDNSKTDADEIRRFYSEVPYLVLDDLGSEKHNEWVEEIIYKLIDDRRDYLRPTIITSNMKPSGISKRYGARVIRRIKDSGLSIEIKDK
jgi:DNA replication protein DnaC